MDSLLDGNSVSHPAEWILSLKLLKLSWSILVQELIEREEATTHADLDIVLFYLHGDPLRSELIDSLRLAHEHDLELLTVWVVVDVLCEFLINRVTFHWDIDGNARFQIDDVLMKRVDLVLVIFDLVFRILQLLQHVKLRRLGIVELFLKLNDVRRCTLKLFLELSLCGFQCVMMLSFHLKLLFNICLLSEMRLLFKNL